MRLLFYLLFIFEKDWLLLNVFTSPDLVKFEAHPQAVEGDDYDGHDGYKMININDFKLEGFIAQT